MPLSLLNHSALALFAQRTRIPTSARSIGFCAIWVCISSSSSSNRRIEVASCVLGKWQEPSVTGSGIPRRPRSQDCLNQLQHATATIYIYIQTRKLRAISGDKLAVNAIFPTKSGAQGAKAKVL